MDAEAQAPEATPLLRARRDARGWGSALRGIFRPEARDDTTATSRGGPSRGVRAVLAVAAVAMLCVGAATFPAPGGNAPGAIGARASLGSGRTVEPGAATVGTSNGRLGADVENGADAPYKHPENIVHYPDPLPPVDFKGKTLLIVMGHPFSGTSGLEGLIGTGAGATSLCASETWQCEDTWLLKYMDFDIEPGVGEFEAYYPVDAAGYAYAFKHFALTWWNMSKPVLMDKTPNLIARHRVIADAAKKLGVPVKFVLLSRHPFSWTSRTHPFDEKRWLKLMKFNRAVLDDDTIDVLHVRYEDLAWRMRETVASVEAFAPELGALDPWRSALAFEERDHNSIQGSRAMPVAEYFKENPLEWKQNWTLSAETFQTLCAVGYTEHGECKEWRRRALPGFETADASDSEEEVALEEISFPEMRRASGAAGGEGPTQRETRPGTATDTPPNAADTARAARAARRRKNRRANPKRPP
jgi:hypothetical protein